MREYIVSGSDVTLTNAAVTAVIINPPSGRQFEVVRAWASQHGTTTSAQCRIGLGTKASAFGTYTSATPAKTKPSDPVSFITGGTAGAAGTAGINASAEGAGTRTIIYPDAFNNLVGYIWTPNLTAGEELIFSSADSLACVLAFLAAPANLTGWNFGVIYRERG